MILTDREIQIALAKSQIFITPDPDIEVYSSTAVDLRLDSHLTEFNDDLVDSAVEKAIDPGYKGFNAEKVLAQLTHQIFIPE